jgi:hypothetical protein
MTMIKPPPSSIDPGTPPVVAVSTRIEARREGLLARLKKEHPEVFVEQLHLRGGTIERAYWHFGYVMALADVLRLLGAVDDGDAEQTRTSGKGGSCTN